MIETAPYISQLYMSNNTGMFRKSHVSSASDAIAANLPASIWGSKEDKYPPTVVARRIIDTFVSLKRFIPRICLDVLGGDDGMEVYGTEPR